LKGYNARSLAPVWERGENAKKRFCGFFYLFFGFVFGLGISLVFTIFWMVVAWRLMRSNERLADTVERIASKLGAAGDNSKNRDE
jgi:uncharacterized membrane protein